MGGQGGQIVEGKEELELEIVVCYGKYIQRIWAGHSSLLVQPSGPLGTAKWGRGGGVGISWFRFELVWFGLVWFDWI